MIDIHSHILPGIDDGARDLEHALQMAQTAVSDGISQIIATPHVISGTFDYRPEQIKAVVAALNDAITARQIPLEILPGGEYRLEADLPARLREGSVLTLNDSGVYLLVEMPASLLPPDYQRVLYEIQLQGVIPVIAHPERNQVIMKQPEILKKLNERGILGQLTAASITGEFGKEIQKCSRRLIEQGSIQFLASDAHTHQGRRSPQITAAREFVKKQYGADYAHALVTDNPACLLKGRDLGSPPQPQPPSWLGRWRK